MCEWKGKASYFDVVGEHRVAYAAAWHYPDPHPDYRMLADHLAFYPGRVDACYIDDELVQPQPGGFYGGWLTADITGPSKAALVRGAGRPGLAMECVAVLGGTGFIRSEAGSALRQTERLVRVASRNPESSTWAGVEQVRCDLESGVPPGD